MKRSASPIGCSQKVRDAGGFRVRSQMRGKQAATASALLGDRLLCDTKTICEEEAEGARYVIDGALRRVPPYFFTYLTYCKLRWRDRKLLDIFTEEFRDRDADFYRRKIANGEVALNRKPANLELVVRNGDLISHRAHRHEPPVLLAPIRIVHQDDDIIAIDKPSGIPVHPTGRYRYNTITKVFEHEHGMIVHPCNRLDRLTSGLMFLGKTARGAEKLTQQIRDRLVHKEYIARCKGKFALGPVVCDKPLRLVQPKVGLNRVDEQAGKEARTEFVRVLYDAATDTSVVKCRPLTGRTHQIRVHLQYLGHPIANDPIYLSEYVWGPQLGAGGSGDDAAVEARLDSIGKTRALLSWIHRDADGETLAHSQCPECETDLYTDPGPNDLELWLHAYKYAAADASWLYQTAYPEWALAPLRRFMELALAEARKCGETQTQFNVGAVLVLDGAVLATGHLRELPGNTHAEQCALQKYTEAHGEVPEGTELYTTMEPCTLRLSGNEPCADRILQTRIRTCFVGVVEPDDFVANNTSRAKLEAAGVEYIHMPGYEAQCLEIAKKGHQRK
jgi:tRNA pseudouridine synthase 8/2,5-diamino-6-(5-phospho-D-ribitylamino)-pyrimidin-4(3H)-one deaminase